MFLLHKKYVCRRDFGFWFYSYLRVRKLIRGEAMNREIGVYERKKKKISGSVFIWNGISDRSDFTEFYFPDAVASEHRIIYVSYGILAGDNSAEYFWQVLKMRGGIFCLRHAAV